MNDDSIATHMYWHVLSVLLTGQKKKKKKKYHGQKDLLNQVDAEYAALVQAASRDPNSLLHPTTKQHISRYVKHLAKMTNTSSSLNTSSEKLLETQQLWHHLTEGSETVSVPVVTLPPAPVNPPSNSPRSSC